MHIQQNPISIRRKPNSETWRGISSTYKEHLEKPSITTILDDERLNVFLMKSETRQNLYSHLCYST